MKVLSIELCRANLGKVIERGDNFPFSRTFPSEDFGTAQQGQFGHGGFNGEALRDHKYSPRSEFQSQTTVSFFLDQPVETKRLTHAPVLIEANLGSGVGGVFHPASYAGLLGANPI